ncbi:MAG: murein hydrolase activator EnvC [Actinomycetota bacterium]
MGSPPGRPSPSLVRAAAVLLGVLLLASLPQAADAGTRGKLHWAERQLRQLEHNIETAQSELATVKKEIRVAEAAIRKLQDDLNALAERLTLAEGAYEHTRALIHETHTALVAARARYERLRDRIDSRARSLYEQGPGGELEFIFGASSIADLSDRVEFVGALAAQDADLAIQTQVISSELEDQQHRLALLRVQQEAQLRDLRERERVLNEKYREQRRLVTDLNDKRGRESSLLSSLADRKSRIADLVARFRQKLAAEERAAAEAAQRAADTATATVPVASGDGPFRACPVQGPHAYSDSFGAPRYAGGYHPHAGNDIFAPRDTPIVAPFNGYAEADPNGLGGNAVIVRGAEGYVYNAHLDHYGTLGSVSAGTVIGYVGNSGDAQGGATHDHFEWHPFTIPANPYRSSYGYTVIGSAIDPYPYLNRVC